MFLSFGKLVATCIYIKCSNTQIAVIRVHLLSSYPLCRSLDSPSDDSIALLGVSEDLATEDLEFPVLLDKSVGDNIIIVDRGPEGGREHTSDLRRG